MIDPNPTFPAGNHFHNIIVVRAVSYGGREGENIRNKDTFRFILLFFPAR